MTTNEGIQFPALRSFNDFLLDARWSMPDFNDLNKINNRVLNNLLYYQTNYFLMGFIMFLCVGYNRPYDFIFGLACLMTLVMAFIYYSKNNQFINDLKQGRPLFVSGILLMSSLLICYTIGYMLIFLLGIFLPISCIFIHSLLRMRNITNKIANRMEKLGLATTPMGIFLEAVGANSKML
ncbi:hypothetical protein GJ496_006102 [Pomphorhynchus laevis]|nr:hypothetical protein GJ496_006102 [Pomphorhynchus laevis]